MASTIETRFGKLRWFIVSERLEASDVEALRASELPRVHLRAHTMQSQDVANCLQALADLPRVRELSIYGCRRTADPRLLKSMAALQSLRLEDVAIGKPREDLVLNRLTRVHIEPYKVASHAWLLRQPRLSAVALEVATQFVSFEPLSHSPSLTSLYLQQSKIKDLRGIGVVPSLGGLQLRHPRLLTSLRGVEEAPNLRVLISDGDFDTSLDLEPLEGAPQLRFLALGSPDGAVLRARPSTLLKLRELWCFTVAARLTAAQAAAVQSLPKLQYFRFGDGAKDMTALGYPAVGDRRPGRYEWYNLAREANPPRSRRTSAQRGKAPLPGERDRRSDAKGEE